MQPLPSCNKLQPSDHTTVNLMPAYLTSHVLPLISALAVAIKLNKFSSLNFGWFTIDNPKYSIRNEWFALIILLKQAEFEEFPTTIKAQHLFLIPQYIHEFTVLPSLVAYNSFKHKAR